MSLALCRVCLASNTRMQNIANTRYQVIFEKLSTKLHTEDKRPEMVCYICYSLLRRCCMFIDMSRKAEEILTQFSHSGIELTEDTVNILDRKFTHKLTITPLQLFSINDVTNSQVKVETQDPASVILNVKEEIDVPIIKKEINEFNQVMINVVIKEEICDTQELGKDRDEEKFTRTMEEVKQEIPDVVEVDSGSKVKVATKENNYVDVCPTNTQNKERIRFPCSHCDKTYLNKFHLNRHLKLHQSTKNTAREYICEVCGWEFVQKSTLIRHIKSHTAGDKRFICDLCPARCSQKNDLERHILSHTGLKPFTCAICKECFSRKSNLKLHILTHDDVRHFKCNICNKNFTRKYDLNRHTMRIHTGAKPYSCHLCDFRSVNASYIKKHVENKHRMKGNTQCDFKCSSLGYLKIHEQKKHASDKSKIIKIKKTF